jgi:hypothetical protein
MEYNDFAALDVFQDDRVLKLLGEPKPRPVDAHDARH